MSQQWDEFSKFLAEESLPRRESLRLLGFALAGAVLSPFGLQTAFAGRHQQDPCKAFCKCRNKSQQTACLAACNACNKDTSRVCGSCGSYACCREAGRYEFGACIDGRCRYACAEGAIYCDGTCTFLGSDPNNCGACDFVCDEPGPYGYGWCENGRCESECYDGAVRCNGKCTDTRRDHVNCGACGAACDDSAPYCSGGQCFDADCGGADLNWDSSNCGYCGNVCPQQFACVYGVCEGSGGGYGGY
jgi:hypothetical protein